jgi:nucleoid-associated protein Lsr2
MMISVVVRQTTVTVTDDLDGSGNAKEVTFGWDGSWWTIDLNAKNRAGLEKALKALLGQGHETARAERPQRRSPCRSSAGPRRGTSRGDLGEVRAWAKSNGHQASDRGRVSAAVQQAYDAAHKRVIG